jgi:hypothetical protein
MGKEREEATEHPQQQRPSDSYYDILTSLFVLLFRNLGSGALLFSARRNRPDC